LTIIKNQQEEVKRAPRSNCSSGSSTSTQSDTSEIPIEELEVQIEQATIVPKHQRRRNSNKKRYKKINFN
jgi:hypothetical protein